MEQDILKIFTEPNNFLIIGKKGSAKTSLGFTIMVKSAELSKRKAYIFRFPNEEILKQVPVPVKNIFTFKELNNLSNAVCLIDEAHLWFDVLNKQVNQELKNILALSRQNNVSFIFVTHNSYFITKGLFSYLDVRIIKEVSEGHWDTERPHMAKLYRETNIIGRENFFIDCDIYRGKESFEKPKWFSDDFSKAYKNTKKKENFFTKIFKCDELRNNANNSEQVRKEK